jgi:hypothetical protein
MPKVQEHRKKRGPYARYPWTKWFDVLRLKGRMILVRGRDFDTTITGIISQLRNRSVKEGLRLGLTPARDDSTLTVVLKGRS